MIIRGDCIEEMKKLEENSVDAIITDPPYGIGFMGKEWDNFKPSHIKEALEKDGREKTRIASTRPSNAAGTYDTSISGSRGFQEFCLEWSKEALRILKPGGYMLVSCSTRMYHRMACGIEDAGFEIRDCIMWLYGSGFPKSLNIGKQIDKIQGNEREVVGKKIVKGGENLNKLSRENKNDDINAKGCGAYGKGAKQINIEIDETKGNSEWEGWGTALKPACEPIVVARKPLSEKNVALNVLKWGTGGINIDACRIGTEIRNYKAGLTNNERLNDDGWDKIGSPNIEVEAQGRFPANIILDEEAGEILGEPSRFFYCAKASKSERNFGCENLEENTKHKKEVASNDKHDAINSRCSNCNDRAYDCNCQCSCGKNDFVRNKLKNNHPTVKPIKLMEYLIKLITKENALVLDPFTGSGTTGIACAKLKRQFVGFEKEEKYVKIAEARIKPYLEQTKL